MKPVIKLLFIAPLLIVVSSCRFTDRDGSVKFNNELMLIDQRVDVSVQIIADSIKAFGKTGEYGAIKDLRLELVDYIGRSITQIGQFEAAGVGCGEFRNEEINLLRLEENKYDTGLRHIETLTAASNEVEVLAAYATINSFNDEISASITRLEQLQLQYAKDNDFKLEHKDLINAPFKKPRPLPPPLIRF